MVSIQSRSVSHFTTLQTITGLQTSEKSSQLPLLLLCYNKPDSPRPDCWQAAENSRNQPIFITICIYAHISFSPLIVLYDLIPNLISLWFLANLFWPEAHTEKEARAHRSGATAPLWARGWVYLWSYFCFRLSEQPQRLPSSGQSACDRVTGALKGKTLTTLLGWAIGKDRM